MKLPNWPALLLAPSLVLASQSIIYALVTPSCKGQSTLALHAVSAVTLLVCAMFTWMARHNWKAAPAPQPNDAAARRPFFIAMVSCLVGVLSCLVIAAMWFPQWVLSPCAS